MLQHLMSAFISVRGWFLAFIPKPLFTPTITRHQLECCSRYTFKTVLLGHQTLMNILTWNYDYFWWLLSSLEACTLARVSIAKLRLRSISLVRVFRREEPQETQLSFSLPPSYSCSNYCNVKTEEGMRGNRTTKFSLWSIFLWTGLCSSSDYQSWAVWELPFYTLFFLFFCPPVSCFTW